MNCPRCGGEMNFPAWLIGHACGVTQSVGNLPTPAPPTYEELRSANNSLQGELRGADDEIKALRSDNAALRERIVLLEGLIKDGVETWKPLLADADLDAGSNPCWLTVMRMEAALSAAGEGK